MTRLAPALAFVSTLIAVRTAVASPLSELAASMRPGTWAELETEQLDATMSAMGASGIKIPYSDDLVWDPTTHRAFFVGGDHADIADRDARPDRRRRLRRQRLQRRVHRWGPYALTAGDPAANLQFGKVWLLPYHTGKSDAQAHPIAYTWYDELIVSTERIADPV